MKPTSPAVETGHITLSAGEPDKARRRFRVNAIVFPLRRLCGHIAIVLMMALHNTLIFGGLGGSTFFFCAGVILLYSLLSWLVLYLFWARVRAVDLGGVFLYADIPVWTLAIYGVEPSL